MLNCCFKRIRGLVETLKIKGRRKYINKTSKIRRKNISNNSFTIISNNCWAGFIYQSYGLKYNTPTIGMFFMADDYLKFISDLEHYISIDKFEEVLPEKSKWYNVLKCKENFGKYPIAKLEDIELHLLHYDNVKDAQNKWNRRKKRINYSNILYKFSEMNDFSEMNLVSFQKLNLDNKLCFISKKYKVYENNYTFVVSNGYSDVRASQEPFGKSRIVNINEVINKM
ncbi:MAG: DUF1919 domain-containing protein [Bacilli bacterium]|nr:DUF1919 domain-containing protein [Bacilli bacterium]